MKWVKENIEVFYQEIQSLDDARSLTHLLRSNLEY